MLNQSLLPEFKHEMAQTRKMLERIPFDQASWQPHARSMTLGQLAVHVAELASWATVIITTKELDFATFDYKPFAPHSTAHLLEHFDQNVEKALETLAGASDETLLQPWSLRRGEQVFFTMPRMAAIRTMAMNHLIHHRGQLSVFLRLKEVPVPGMYGPSADDVMR